MWACVVIVECDVDLGGVWLMSCFSVGMKEGACGFSFVVSLS